MNNSKKEWANSFGEEYTKQNMFTTSELNKLYKSKYGITRAEMNHEFLDFLDRDIMILEVGSNIGNQLHLLHNMGFENLYGLEINSLAIKTCNKLNENMNKNTDIKYCIHFLPNCLTKICFIILL